MEDKFFYVTNEADYPTYVGDPSKEVAGLLVKRFCNHYLTWERNFVKHQVASRNQRISFEVWKALPANKKSQAVEARAIELENAAAVASFDLSCSIALLHESKVALLEAVEKEKGFDWSNYSNTPVVEYLNALPELDSSCYTAERKATNDHNTTELQGNSCGRKDTNNNDTHDTNESE